MKRKLPFLTICALLFAFCVCAQAQQLSKAPRLGYLNAGANPARSPRTEAMRQGLRQLGYIEGQNIFIEYRYAEGESEKLPELVRELLNLKVDIIFAQGTMAVRAAKNATATVPIVTTSADPIRAGFVESLARPGGNITGLTNFTSELAGKRLELLKEIVPRLSVLAVLWTSSGSGSELAKKEIEIAAQSLGVELRAYDVTNANDVEPVFSTMKRERVGALIVLRSLVIINQIERIVELALKSRLLALVDDRNFVRMGALASYGTNLVDLDRRAATYIDKILKGAKPADLPVEQPTKFELVINLKAAKHLGVTIPGDVLRWADEVIK